MRRIALIHTVRSVYETFEIQLKSFMPDMELKVHNVLDEFLASDAAPSESGYFTVDNKRRLLYQLLAAELTKADLIVTTCSQLSSTAKDLSCFIRTPIITIDEAMIAASVSVSTKIALLSTAAGTVNAISEMLLREAESQGKHIDINVVCNNNAITALKAGRLDEHDKIVREMAASIKECGVALIAQASAAHMGTEVAAISGIPTYTGILSCLEKVKDFLTK